MFIATLPSPPSLNLNYFLGFHAISSPYLHTTNLEECKGFEGHQLSGRRYEVAEVKKDVTLEKALGGPEQFESFRISTQTMERSAMKNARRIV